MATKQIFNARSQKVEDAELTVDAVGEIVATFEDGGAIKFPAGLTQEEFDSLVAEHQTANEGQEVITPEMEAAQAAQRAASEAIVNGADNTMSGKDQSNEPAAEQPTSPIQ